MGWHAMGHCAIRRDGTVVGGLGSYGMGLGRVGARGIRVLLLLRYFAGSGQIAAVAVAAAAAAVAVAVAEEAAIADGDVGDVGGGGGDGFSGIG